MNMLVNQQKVIWRECIENYVCYIIVWHTELLLRYARKCGPALSFPVWPEGDKRAIKMQTNDMNTCIFECLFIDVGDVLWVQKVIQRILPRCRHKALWVVLLLRVYGARLYKCTCIGEYVMYVRLCIGVPSEYVLVCIGVRAEVRVYRCTCTGE